MSALKSGGSVVIRVQNAESDVRARLLRRVLYGLYKRLHWKIGHLFPPRGRVAYAFDRLRCCRVTTDYADPHIDVVLVKADVLTDH